MTDRTKVPARRATLILALLVALVLAQSLGFIHRITHANHEAAGQLAVASAEQVEVSDHASLHWLESLFTGHDHAGGCEAYDQFTHADALWGVPAAVLPVVTASRAVAVHRTWHLAAQSAGYLARGPPELS